MKYCPAHHHFYRDESRCKFCRMDSNIDAAVAAEHPVVPRPSGCPDCLRDLPCGCDDRDREEARK